MSITSLVQAITSDLNDDAAGHENQTWSTDQIRVWVEEGLNLAFDNRPDLFMQHVNVKVTPCSILQDKCECDNYRRVLGQSNADGRLLNTIPTRGLELSLQWKGKVCKPAKRNGQFRLEGYAIDEQSDTLYIWPEVPPTEDVYVLVECAHRPTAEELESGDYEMPLGTMASVKQWVLFRAISMDAEVSNSAMTRSQIHYKAFFETLGLSANTQTVIHKRGTD